jgi:hypothetical protein
MEEQNANKAIDLGKLVLLSSRTGNYFNER